MGSSKFFKIIYPVNEVERVRVLESLKILKTAPEAQFDDLVKLAAQVAGVQKAALSLIDTDTQWFKAKTSAVVPNGSSRQDSFCTHTILKPKHTLFIIEDASKDEVLRDNPWVTTTNGIRFYAGVPLVLFDSYSVGSLCVFDSLPRRLSVSQMEALVKIADVAIRRLEALSPEVRSHALRSFFDFRSSKKKKSGS